jgi:RNA polymerase subunit RPABC4/transcription elongation factor Spt4
MINPSIISNLTLILTTWGTAFIVALWLSVVIWTYRDIRKRTGDRLLQVLAILIVTILFLPGVLIYLVMRPQQTLEEEYQKSLEEEALLNAIDATPHCPGCSRRVNDKWLVCPDCHTRLKKSCHHCGKLMELQWNICPHCATPAPGMKKEGLSLDEAIRPTPSELNPMEE